MDPDHVLKSLRNFDPPRQDRNVGDEADVAHQLIALSPRIAAEHSQLAFKRRKPENRIERGRLTCAVGTDQAQDPAFLHSQVNVVERDRCAKAFAETACLYACHSFNAPPFCLGLLRPRGERESPVVASRRGRDAESSPAPEATLPREISGARLATAALVRRRL